MSTALDILIRAKDEATRTVNSVGSSIKRTSHEAESGAEHMGRLGKTTERAGEQFRGALKGFAAAAGIAEVGEMATKSFEAFEQLEVGEKRLGYGLKRIGEGKEQLDGLVGWAKDFSKETSISEATILGMESKLTAMGGTFLKSLGPNADGVIKKITAGITNLGSATGRSAERLMRSLGPSLMNAPETAATQLRQYGALTDAQYKKVLKLTKAGKMHAASMLEINALNKKYAGVAAASATAMDKIKNGINQAELAVGSLLNKGLTWLVDVGWPAFKNGVAAAMQKAAPFIAMLKNAAAGILPALKSAFLTILPSVKQLLHAIAPIAKVLGIVVGLIVLGLLKALPILIKVLAVAIAMYIKLEAVLVNVVVGALRAVAGAFMGIVHAGQTAVGWIITGWNKAVSFISGLPGRISHATIGMFDGIKDAFRSAINWVIGGWNRLQFSLPKVNTHIPGVGTIGGWTLGTPDIPYLAQGGIATRATLAVIGEAGPEAVIPLSKAGGMLGGGNLHLSLDRRRFVAAGDFDVKYRGY